MAHPDPDLRGTLGAALIRLMRRHRAAVGAELAQLGLHVGQEWLLVQLAREDGSSQAELSRCLGVEQPTITKTVQRLESAGFVRRAPDAGDARVNRVWLTERGRAAERELVARWEDVERRMRHGLDADEVRHLRELVDRMAGNLGPEGCEP